MRAVEILDVDDGIVCDLAHDDLAGFAAVFTELLRQSNLEVVRFESAA